jgi:adenosine/AMP kinase
MMFVGSVVSTSAVTNVSVVIVDCTEQVGVVVEAVDGTTYVDVNMSADDAVVTETCRGMLVKALEYWFIVP